MNLKRFFFILSLCLAYPSVCHAGAFLEYLSRPLRSEGALTKVRFAGSIQEKKDILDRLRQDKEEILKQKEFLEKIQNMLKSISEQIEILKKELVQKPLAEHPYINQQITILNELYQTLLNYQFSHKELLAIIDQHIHILEEYIKDPEFSSLERRLHTFHTFDELQEISKRYTQYEEKLKRLQEQKQTLANELDAHKRKLSLIGKDHDKHPELPEQLSSLDTKQQAYLLDLHAQLHTYEKNLAELKVQEFAKKNAYIDTAINLETEKLRILKNYITRIKDSLRIEPRDIQQAKDGLEKARKESLAAREGSYESIKKLAALKEEYLKELDGLKKKYNVADLTLIAPPDWNVNPKTVDQYLAISEIGLKQEQIALIDSKIDALKADIEKEKLTLKRHDISVEILISWFKITRRQLKTSESITQELKHYQGIISDLNREEASIKDKRSIVTNHISSRTLALNKIRNLILDLKNNKETLFLGKQNKYTLVQPRMSQAEKAIEGQLEQDNRLSTVYAQLLTLINTTQQDINSIIHSLESKSIWQRSEYAISFNGIKNIGHDIIYFIKDVSTLTYSYVQSAHWSTVRHFIGYYVHNPLIVLSIIIRLFFLILFFLLLRFYIPSIIAYCLAQQPFQKPAWWLWRVLATVLSFIFNHLVSIYAWFTALILIYTESITDPLVLVYFYLGSIVYLVYLIHSFIQFVLLYNEQHNHMLFAPSFRKRFILISSLLGYLTVIILFFREAFITATYHASEFPTILLASYSIIVRILIIFSIGKDEILSIIPSRGALWNTVAHIIDHYYYPLLALIIMLMIMSDSYVGGYGNLVAYILWGIVGTALLIKILLIGQSYLKKNASYLFFATDEETLKERFLYAKTWYGLFVVALFIIFSIVGIVLALRIWGKLITLHDLRTALNYELLSTGFDAATGHHMWLTPLKILAVLGFICTGFLISFAVNSFVLNRIFQLLPVDIGIQNTVSSLTRYLIVIATIFLAFQWGGLGSLLIALGIIVGSISYIVKEPISDFISYFIILVQRPLKIGDFVMIQNHIGVVRHITPRSVIIREKNSHTIIVPNSSIITQKLVNWNYSRGFIGCDDIFLTVHYHHDPSFIKTLLEQTVDQIPDILKSPKPIIRLEDFTDVGYKFMIRCFISSNRTLDLFEITGSIRLAIAQAFTQQHIQFAIPIRISVREEYLAKDTTST